MKAEYRRELTRNYLVLEDEYGFSYENYRVRMITRNRIPSFLECRVQMVDGILFFYYDTSDTCPLSTVFQNHPVQRKEMENLLRAIDLAMKSAGTYFLESAGVLLDPDYIFFSPGEERYFFCYLPGREACFAETFRELSEFLLEHLDYGEKEGVVLGYGIYKKAQEEHTCLEGLLALLSEEAFLPEEEQENRKVFQRSEPVPFEKKEEVFSDTRRKKVKSLLDILGGRPLLASCFFWRRVCMYYIEEDCWK